MFKVDSRSPLMTDMSDVEYTFSVQLRSSDKLHTIVSGLLAICPRKDDRGFSKYASLVSDRRRPCKCTLVHLRCSRVEKLVRDVIKREICLVAALKTMEEINKGSGKFIHQVLSKIELELYKYGLIVNNASCFRFKELPWYSVRYRWRRALKLLIPKLR
ncbi:hypothetical protein POM88_040466 [Heracleum sosnowskyi]|uniref:Flotillin-like n=1 Tax=Heracleum sosnowskyi TaxID=360622 RepID=A0AAD8M7F7_9APIA|nr:hypothetical protein POM88_040466 [Heracleum sosnowskyi]